MHNVVAETAEDATIMLMMELSDSFSWGHFAETNDARKTHAVSTVTHMKCQYQYDTGRHEQLMNWLADLCLHN